jgi:hypothetical protein
MRPTLTHDRALRGERPRPFTKAEWDALAAASLLAHADATDARHRAMRAARSPKPPTNRRSPMVDRVMPWLTPWPVWLTMLAAGVVLAVAGRWSRRTAQRIKRAHRELAARREQWPR